MQKINWGLSKKKPLGGFTLIEVLVVVFVLSMGVIVIMQGINKTTTYISETAQRTIALSLAKEGLEAIYNIRNSNWRRWSDSKNMCRLKADPMVDSGNDWCANDEWIRYVRGYISTKEIEGNQYYVYIPAVNGIRNPIVWPSCWWFEHLQRKANFPFWIKTFFLPWIARKDWHRNFLLHFVNGEWIDEFTYQRKYWSPLNPTKPDTSMGGYGRYIQVEWLYDKGENDPYACLDCVAGVDQQCWDDRPKELRFCSLVFYYQPYMGYVEVCSIMTNFLK